MESSIAQFEALQWAWNIAKNRDNDETAYQIEQMLFKISEGFTPDFPQLSDNLQRMRS